MLPPMADVSTRLAANDLPSGRWFSRAVVRIYGIATAVVVSAGSFLFIYGIDLDPVVAFQTLPWVIPPMTVLTLLADWLVIRRTIAPIVMALDAQLPSQQVWLAAYRRALELPLMAGKRVLFVHVPVAGLSGHAVGALCHWVLDADVPWHVWLQSWLVLVLLGTGHALGEYFESRKLIRWLIPRLRHRLEVPPHEAPKGFVGLGHKILVASILLGLGPMLLVCATLLLRLQRISRELHANVDLSSISLLIIWLLICTGAAVVYLALMFARHVSRESTDMVSAQDQIAAGNLTAELTVISDDEFGSLALGFNRMVQGLRERERLRDAFGVYVSPEVANSVAQSGSNQPPRLVHASVLFADIRGFTTLSERLAPSEVVDLLNRYFAVVEPAIAKHGGWINKFGGDSLLAVFGTPTPLALDARHALAAALEMREVLEQFNLEQQSRGEAPLKIGIGLHCGPLVAGTVGSQKRMEYTVIGDTVNLAARLQDATKNLDTEILVSADLATAALDTPWPEWARREPALPVRGKLEPVEVVAILPDARL